MDKVKLGIIGAGTISKRHLDGYRQNPQAEVCVICDVNTDTAKARAEEFGIPVWYTDPMQILEDPAIDTVSIVTPTFTHKDLVIAALEHGKHVLCEKPPALNAEEAAQCEAAAKRSGKVLMYGFVMRFHKDTVFLKDYADTGAMGKIYYAEVARLARSFRIGGWFVNKELSGGGPMIDSVIHQLDMTLYLMGYPQIHSVKGFTSYELNGLPYAMKGIPGGWVSADTNSYDRETETLAGGLIRFKDGSTMFVKASWVLNTTNPGNLVELCGTKAGARVDADGPHLIRADESGYYLESQPVLKEEYNMFHREMDHFVDCCLGNAECIIKPREGTQIMEIIDAIYTSAESGQEVVF